MNIISYSNITTTPFCVKESHFAGSAHWQHCGDMLYEKQDRKIAYEIKGNIYKNYLQTLTYCNILNLPFSENAVAEAEKKIANYGRYITQYRELRHFIDSPKPKSQKTYHLNKAKVRKRLVALCRLQESKDFLAFYSISFPANAPDNSLYEIFNRWLTNCRTRYGLSTYLWVAERQKNGTLHFHILTNNRMNISIINRAMAESINTSVLQEKLTWGQSSLSLYNGLDVDSITNPKHRQGENRKQYRSRIKEIKKHTIKERVKFAIKYLTKYITKNDEVFVHLPSHSSRDISQLFTSFVLTDKDFEQYKNYTSDSDEDYIIYSDEVKTVYVFKKLPDDMLYNMLDKLNNILYTMYHNEHDPPPSCKKKQNKTTT